MSREYNPDRGYGVFTSIFPHQIQEEIVRNIQELGIDNPAFSIYLNDVGTLTSTSPYFVVAANKALRNNGYHAATMKDMFAIRSAGECLASSPFYGFGLTIDAEDESPIVSRINAQTGYKNGLTYADLSELDLVKDESAESGLAFVLRDDANPVKIPERMEPGLSGFFNYHEIDDKGFPLELKEEGFPETEGFWYERMGSNKTKSGYNFSGSLVDCTKFTNFNAMRGIGSPFQIMIVSDDGKLEPLVNTPKGNKWSSLTYCHNLSDLMGAMERG